MLIVYSGANDEIIVTTTKREQAMLDEYFGSEEMERNIDDYDRDVVHKNGTAVVIVSEVKREW